MAKYRVESVDLSTRVGIALMMLLPFPVRAWGWVSEMARQLGISRTLMYSWRDRALKAVFEALMPQAPGPKPQYGTLPVTRDFIRYAIVVLSLVKGSIRDIQLALELLFGVHRALGTIAQTLQAAGEEAERYHVSLRIPAAVLGEADEIFQGSHPHLTVVDGRAFLVLHLSRAEARDKTTWGIVFLDLQERGVRFLDVASDGAQGIHQGVQEAGLAIPVRHDLFHFMRRAHTISRRLERRAYKAIKIAERARRAAREAQAPKRRPGRPLEVKVPLPEAEAEEEAAIDLHDAWQWLLGEVRQALEPVQADGRLGSAEEARRTLEAAADLMAECDDADIQAFGQHIRQHLDALVEPLAWLEAQLAPWRDQMDAQTEAMLVRAWQKRQGRNMRLEALPVHLQPLAQVVWKALSLYHRASSLAEAFHSWLRPYLRIHKGLPSWLAPLLMVLWNHRRFIRGQRQGKCPLEWAGVQDVPSLADVLKRISQPLPTEAGA